MIRNALINDLPILLSISQRSFETPWSPASFEAELHKSFSKTYLFLDKEQPVGYLIIWVMENEGEIVSLAVDPGWRNKGIAKKLLEYAFSSYKIVKKWSLEVNPLNHNAINLYRKYKFERLRTIRNYYGQGKDAIYMVKNT